MGRIYDRVVSSSGEMVHIVLSRIVCVLSDVFAGIHVRVPMDIGKIDIRPVMSNNEISLGM